VGRLASLRLSSLRLAALVPPALWGLLAPVLTRLSWHSVSAYPDMEGLLPAEQPLQRLMQVGFPWQGFFCLLGQWPRRPKRLRLRRWSSGHA
jgi:hypothetical protein